MQSARLEQLAGGVGGVDAELLQQLHHEAAEALERARQSNLRVNLNQHTLGRAHIQPLRRNALSACS